MQEKKRSPQRHGGSTEMHRGNLGVPLCDLRISVVKTSF